MQTQTRQQQADSSSAHERIYRHLRARIMHGELDPGASLTIRGIGAEYDVSMTPAREAVRRLAAEGALTLSSSGRVTTPDLTPERIEELAALRALLEPELAARALPRAHLALIDRLRAINARVTECVANKDAVGYLRSNLEFHPCGYSSAPPCGRSTRIATAPTCKSITG